MLMQNRWREDVLARIAIFALGALALVTSDTWAAEISASLMRDGGGVVVGHNPPTPVWSSITISGRILEDDDKKFSQVVKKIPKSDPVLVILEGPGGDFSAGLEIGIIIRNKHFDTSIQREGLCASACAAIWLAGKTRFSHPLSLIGFHAAYARRGDGSIIDSPIANAWAGAYYRDLGLSYKAIACFVQSPPYQLTFLSQEAAEKYHIDVAQGSLPKETDIPRLFQSYKDQNSP